jgi:hypothetical protein
MINITAATEPLIVASLITAILRYLNIDDESEACTKLIDRKNKRGQKYF